MRCTEHRKDFEGDCTWCGKKLCEYCIAKTEGRKFYCEHCTAQLSMYKRTKLPQAKSKEIMQEEPVQEQPKKKPKFVLDKDGYLMME